jgi:hypothetical protein
MLQVDKIARTFLEAFGFSLFFLLSFVLEKYVWYKICSSDFALSNKKKFDLFIEWQYGLTESDIYSKDFCIGDYQRQISDHRSQESRRLSWGWVWVWVWVRVKRIPYLPTHTTPTLKIVFDLYKNTLYIDQSKRFLHTKGNSMNSY